MGVVSELRVSLQELLNGEIEVVERVLEQLDLSITGVSNNIVRQREIRDIFLVSLREKKRTLHARQSTLTCRRRIYEETGVPNARPARATRTGRILSAGGRTAPGGGGAPAGGLTRTAGGGLNWGPEAAGVHGGRVITTSTQDSSSGTARPVLLSSEERKAGSLARSPYLRSPYNTVQR